MCFSPTASFTASAVLTVAGTASLVRSKTIPQRFLSLIPFIFALQQFVEGILWLSLLHPANWAHWERPATYGFLFFAQMMWPFFVPLCMWLYETDPLKKKIIAVLWLAGTILSAYIGYCLYQYPVQAVADQHHIRYDLGFALAHKWYYGILYFLPTIVAPIITTEKKLHWLGYLFLGSYILTRWLFHHYEISVWCFFGAIISLVVYIIVTKQDLHDTGKQKSALAQ